MRKFILHARFLHRSYSTICHHLRRAADQGLLDKEDGSHFERELLTGIFFFKFSRVESGSLKHLNLQL